MTGWVLTVLLLLSLVISEVLEDVIKNDSEDELEGLAALFFGHGRKPAVRIRGYVEEVVANLLDNRFKCNFRLSCVQGTSHKE